MTLKELEQAMALRQEIKLLRARAARPAPTVSDTVKGCTPSRSDYHTIPITGQSRRTQIRAEQARASAIRKAEKLEKLVTEIDVFIDSIDDSTVRQIIRLRYIDGLAWQDVAKAVYGFADATTPYNRIKRFFEKK